MAKKSKEFMIGFGEAERRFNDNPIAPDLTNPYEPGTDEHMGFEECVYLLTQDED